MTIQETTFKELKEGLLDNRNESEAEYYNQAVEDTANATLEWVLREIETAMRDEGAAQCGCCCECAGFAWEKIISLKDQLNKDV